VVAPVPYIADEYVADVSVLVTALKAIAAADDGTDAAIVLAGCGTAE